MPTDALPPDWRRALGAAAGARRTLVIGAKDVGKSHFVLLAIAAHGGAAALVDLDPGQMMIGPPGTLGLGLLRREAAPEQFHFIGSTSPVHLREFLPAVRSLVHRRRRRLIVDTSGLVRGLGVRLQRLTIDAVRPDLIVAIADGRELDPILADLTGVATECVRPSPSARRKGAGERRRAREQAFGWALRVPSG